MADPVSCSILGHNIVIIMSLVCDCYRHIYCRLIRRHSYLFDRTWFSFPPNVLFLYKIEINLKSLFILCEKILVFQVKCVPFFKLTMCLSSFWFTELNNGTSIIYNHPSTHTVTTLPVTVLKLSCKRNAAE